MDNSPFGRLPPEIRLMIYGKVVREGRQIYIIDSYIGVHYRCRPKNRRPFLDALSLRGVCQVMRRENAGLYFSTNHIFISPRVYILLPVTAQSVIKMNLYRMYKVVMKWGAWFGCDVPRLRTIVIDIGTLSSAQSVGWPEIRRAIAQLSGYTRMYLLILVVPTNDDTYYERSYKFPHIRIRPGERNHALRKLEELATWYAGRSGKGRCEISKTEALSMMRRARQWFGEMPKRG